MSENNILKVDLDIDSELKAKRFITERLKFLSDTNILPFKYISTIILIKKNKHSVKIYLKKELPPQSLILFQSILGDDFKRTAITLRDYHLGIRNYNRMFDVKRYMNGEYISSEKKIIYDYVSERINKKI